LRGELCGDEQFERSGKIEFVACLWIEGVQFGDDLLNLLW
jgi:hypothetical protein